MGFGEGHGAEEAAVDHRLQEQPLLRFVAEAFDQVGRAHGQERVGGGAGVGGLKVGEAGLRDQARQLHAADVEVAVGIEQARVEKRLHGGFDLRDQLSPAVHIARFVLVAFAVVRGEVLFRQAARSAQRGVEGFAVVLGETRAGGQGLGIEDFIEFERKVAAAEELLGHGGIPGIGMRRV